MSIQSEINRGANPPDGVNPTKIITAIGQAGDANVPAGTYLHLRRCQAGKLVVGEGCVLVLEQSTVVSVEMAGGNLTLDRTAVSGKLTLTEVKASQKLGTVTGTMVISGGSLDSYKSSWSGGPIALTVGEGCNLILRSDTFEGGELKTGVTVEGGCFAQIRNCSFNAILNGVHVTGSQVDIVGGSILGQFQWGVRAGGGSRVSISGVKTPIKGGNEALRCDTDSSITLTNSAGAHGGEVGIHALARSSVRVSRFQLVQGDSNSGIQATDGGTVECSSGGRITSLATDAVRLTAGHFVGRSIDSISSPAGDGIHSSGGSTVSLHTVRQEIRGYAGNGVSADSGDTYTITDCPTIRGDVGDGVRAGSSCTLLLSRVQSIAGMAGDGVSLGDGCSLTLIRKDSDPASEIVGKAGNGVTGGDGCSVTLQRVDRVTGETGHGLSFGSGLRLQMDHSQAVLGQVGSGIQCGDESTVEVRNFGTVFGRNAYGISIGGRGSLTVLHGNEVHGFLNSGLRAGSGSSLRAENVERIIGQENGCGVQVESGTIILRSIAVIEGPDSGIRCVGGTSADVQGVDICGGGDSAGLRVDGGGTTTYRGGSLLHGGARGVMVTDSVVSVSGVGILRGNPESVHAFGVSQVTITGCGQMLGNAWSEGSSDLTIYGCPDFQGDISTDQAVITLTRVVQTNGGVELSGGEMIARQVTVQSGDVRVDSASLRAEFLDIQAGTLDMVASGASLLSCNSRGGSLTGSGLLAANCDMGDLSLDGGAVLAVGGSMNVVGSGSAWLCDSGTVALPVSGGYINENLTYLQGTQLFLLAQTLLQMTAGVTAGITAGTLIQLLAPTIDEGSTTVVTQVGTWSQVTSLPPPPGTTPKVRSLGDWIVSQGIAGVHTSSPVSGDSVAIFNLSGNFRKLLNVWSPAQPLTGIDDLVNFQKRYGFAVNSSFGDLVGERYTPQVLIDAMNNPAFGLDPDLRGTYVPTWQDRNDAQYVCAVRGATTIHGDYPFAVSLFDYLVAWVLAHS